MAMRTVPPITSGVNSAGSRAAAPRDLSLLITRGLALVLGAALLHLVVHGPVRSAALGLRDDAASRVIAVVSVVQLILGLVVFLRAGGRAITPIGVYFLANALYFGYGGLAPAESKTTEQYYVYASVVALTFNLWVFLVATRTTEAWSRSREARAPAKGRARAGTPREAAPTALSLPLHVGLWLGFTVGVPIIQRLPIIGIYADLMQIAVSLLLLQAFLRNSLSDHPLRFAVGLPVFAAMSLGSYLFIFYTGYGRIILAGFLTASAVLIGRRYRWLPIKAIALVAIVPAIAFAGANERTGLSFEEALGGVGEARGVGSMTGVMPVLAMTLERYDDAGLEEYAHRAGRTFWVSAVHWVPREWWPEKPNGPEIELAQLLYPENGFGYSIVGSNAVEWILNFDPPGLIPGAIITGLALGMVDRWARGTPRRRRALPHDTVARALVTGNLLIFVWAGSFSFSARTLTGLVLIAALRRVARTARGLQPSQAPITDGKP